MKTKLGENELFPFQRTSAETRKFLLLGDSKSVPDRVIEERIKFGTGGEVAESIWGTLGWENNAPFIVDGDIEFSEKGQDDAAEGATLDEIKDLYEINDSLNVSDKKTRVLERYINLDELRFKLPKTVKLGEIPKLRLNIFLKKEEGALVFYQHSEINKHSDENAFVEYILPHKTDDQNSFDRLMLQYSIPINPAFDLEETKTSGIFKLVKKNNQTSFIIKILTFVRKETDSDSVFKNAMQCLNKKITEQLRDKSYEWIHDKVGYEKYKLLIFDPSIHFDSEIELDFQEKKKKKKKVNYGGTFKPLSEENTIDPNKRTLLLLHGTWSSTYKSFGNLLEKSNAKTPSFLQRLIQNGNYEQIIAFDRPTMSGNVYQNIDVLFQRLQGVKFNTPIDIITTSQGALVAEALSSFPQTKGYFSIRRVLMFSAANGCGYFKTADQIGLLLSIMRKNSGSLIGKVLFAAAQHSADWFVKNPGLKQMHPDDQLLAQILSAVPNNSSTEYINVVSDWDMRLMKGNKRILRLPAVIIDALIKLSLGSKHDWVIGCDAQEKFPVRSPQFDKIEIAAMHGKYLDLSHVGEITDKKWYNIFKNDLLKPFDSHEMIIEKLAE
jgi:hypothetical protein